MMLSTFPLALLTLHTVMASPILSTFMSKDCVAVDSDKCGTSFADSCLDCGTGAYNCLKCCKGCELVTKAGYGYCVCGKGPSPKPSPSPAPGISTTTGNLTWAGKERQYISLVPDHPPSGLIVVLSPVTSKSLPYSCDLGNVSAETGAIVVCPAALAHDDTKGGQPEACWKAWGNYGTCGIHNDSEDVDFLAALIEQLVRSHSIPASKVIMSGFSNGGSMAFRFNCERSDLIGGLAIQSQAYFDPYVGYYDYENNVVPTGTPQCNPQFKRPFYSDVGTVDVYYGLNVSTPGFQGLQKWRDNYSTAVLGCTGEVTTTSKGPHSYPDGTAPATCYEYSSCPGITGAGLNRFCSVPGMGHDFSGFLSLLPQAFTDFFSNAA